MKAYYSFIISIGNQHVCVYTHMLIAYRKHVEIEKVDMFCSAQKAIHQKAKTIIKNLIAIIYFYRNVLKPNIKCKNFIQVFKLSFGPIATFQKD